MAITWDGDIVRLIDQAPAVLPEVKKALETGEYTYVDYTELDVRSRQTKGIKNLFVYALIGVGIFLVLKGR